MSGYRDYHERPPPSKRALLFDAFLNLTMVGMGTWILWLVYPGRTMLLIGSVAILGTVLGFALQLKRLRN